MLTALIRFLSSKFAQPTTQNNDLIEQAIQSNTPVSKIVNINTDRDEVEKLLQPITPLQQEIKDYLHSNPSLEPETAIFTLAFEQITQDIRFESEEIKQCILSRCLENIDNGLQAREKAIREILTHFDWDFYDEWMDYYEKSQAVRPILFPKKRNINSQAVKNRLLISAITTRFYTLRNIHQAESRTFISAGGRLGVFYYEYELLAVTQTETEAQYLKENPAIENNQILRLPPFILGSTTTIRPRMHTRYEKLLD